MLNVARTVCTAHSSMGALEKEQAMSYAHFLTWCGFRRQLQEPLLIQECVDSFPREEMVELLDMYDLTWSIT